jgi:hypothetical protein
MSPSNPQPDPTTSAVGSAASADPDEYEAVDGYTYTYGDDESTPTLCSLTDDPKPVSGKGVALFLLAHVRDAETKDVVAVDVRVRQGDYRRTRTMPASVVRAGQAADPWHKHTGLSLTPTQARGASTWLSAAIAADVPRERTRFEVQRPTWTGDRLQLPSSMHWTAGCSETRARECWRWVIEIGRRYPKLAITLGAYVASPLLERWGLAGGGLNLLDDSSTGKTTSARAGSAIFNKPSAGNDPSWLGTFNSKTAELADSGGMPLFWDDANNTAESEVTLAKLVMAVAQGREKGRLNQHSEQHDKRCWRLVVVSTSENSLLTKGTVGAAARWVEIHGQFLPDAKTAESMDALTREAYGYPGKWLTENNWKLPELPVLGDTGSPVANRAGKLLAAYAAGFGELARAVGVGVPAEEIRKIGQTVLDEVAEGMAEDGNNSSERARIGIWDDYVSNPTLFPAWISDSGPLSLIGTSRPLRGFTKDGQLWYFAKRARELAEERNFDLVSAMQGLHKCGDLDVKTPNHGLQERTPRIGGAQVKAYVFDLGGLAESTTSGLRDDEDFDREAAKLFESTKVAV